MTVRTLVAAAPSLRLAGGMQVKFEAISATTGAAVAGVKVTNVNIYGKDLALGAVDKLNALPAFKYVQAGP